MVYVSAGDLKKRGISLLDDIVEEQEGAIITVRGKSKYVVIDMDAYNRFREYELEAALAETRKDLAEGNVVEESVEDHIKRIRNEL
ncbi:MAG: type II toxin-antitoxin system Phd/YefM family antitoxin [bacterium]|nr:type II toxin-antitoxin system Phd/YefM family antitoxin [bacterium]